MTWINYKYVTNIYIMTRIKYIDTLYISLYYHIATVDVFNNSNVYTYLRLYIYIIIVKYFQSKS